MAADTHIIQRQVLDITLDTDRGAYLVQEEVRRVYYEQVVPMLDTAFSSLVGSDEVVRLDRLDLDLGHLSSRNLEEEFLAAVSAQLAEVLPLRVRRASRAGETLPEDPAAYHTTTLRSKLDIFVMFMQTGRVPWWVPEPSRYDPSTELAALLDESPEDLREALATISRPLIHRRLAHQIRPETLSRLIQWAAPDDGTRLLGVLHRMETVYEENPLPALSPASFRRVLWAEAIGIVLGLGSSSRSLISYVEAVAQRLSAQGVPVAHLREHLAQIEAPSDPEAAVLTAWVREKAGERPMTKDTPAAEMQRRRKDSGDVREHDRGEADLDRPDEGRAEVAPAVTEEAAEQEDPQRSRSERAGKAGDAEAVSSEEQQTGPALEDRKPRSPTLENKDLDTAASNEARTTRSAEGEKPTQRSGDPVPYRVEALAEGDVQYITNAGIILLWPYLGRFFKNLGLVEGGAFVSDEAQLRAVLLTHYLVTTETEVSEHGLLLNKLLCGLPPEDTVPNSFDLTPDEAEQSRVLLETVIAHWEALKNTSPDGLRQAFLQRDGKLVRQADQWMLFIERKGYDVLLDRLPWGISLVKMAWMPEPIFVEW